MSYLPPRKLPEASIRELFSVPLPEEPQTIYGAADHSERVRRLAQIALVIFEYGEDPLPYLRMILESMSQGKIA